MNRAHFPSWQQRVTDCTSSKPTAQHPVQSCFCEGITPTTAMSWNAQAHTGWGLPPPRRQKLCGGLQKPFLPGLFFSGKHFSIKAATLSLYLQRKEGVLSYKCGPQEPSIIGHISTGSVSKGNSQVQIVLPSILHLLLKSLPGVLTGAGGLLNNALPIK